MEPIKKRRVSSMVVESIEKMILEKKIEPGDKLPSENMLARSLEVSRTTIREAIRILELQGRVTVYQGKGIFLAEAGLNWFSHHQDSIQELFEVRTLVESHAASRAAENIGQEDLAEIRRLHAAYKTAIDQKKTNQAIELDKAFHNKIADLSGNTTLKQIMKTIVSELSKGWVASLQVPMRQEKTVAEHSRIIDALAKGQKEEAALEMTSHLSRALEDIQHHYEKGNTQ